MIGSLDGNTAALNEYLRQQEKIDNAYENAEEWLSKEGTCGDCKYIDDCLDEEQTTEETPVNNKDCFEASDSSVESYIEANAEPPEYW